MRFSNMSEHVETCLNLFRFNVIWIDTILKHVWTCSNMSKLVQIQYDTNCYNSGDPQTCLNMFKHEYISLQQQVSDMFQHVQTCSRITWIVTIHIILNLNKFRHVWESHESWQFISYWIWTSSDTFENHMNYNNSDLENLKNLDNWVL